MSDFDVMPDFLAGLERDLRGRAAALDAEAMPDFLPALEQQLRRRAAATARRRRPTVRWRRPVFAVAFAASILAQALTLHAPVVHETPAFGSPPILEVPTVQMPANADKIGQFEMTHSAVTEARQIEGFGEPAYLIKGGDYWCVWLLDDGPPSGGSGAAAVCARNDDFYRNGIAMKIGRRYLAVLPAHDGPPILQHADGTADTIEPTSDGVVALKGWRPGDRFVVHRPDGSTFVDRNRGLDRLAGINTADDTNTTTNTTDDEEG